MSLLYNKDDWNLIESAVILSNDDLSEGSAMTLKDGGWVVCQIAGSFDGILVTPFTVGDDSGKILQKLQGQSAVTFLPDDVTI